MRRAIVFALLILAGCVSVPARAPDPVIDPRTVSDPAQLIRDLGECRVMSDQSATGGNDVMDYSRKQVVLIRCMTGRGYRVLG